MKKLFFLGACLVALSGRPAKAQAADPDIVVVRIYESGAKVEMGITRAPGTTVRNQYFAVDAGKEFYKMVYKLYKQGYTLQSTFDAGSDKYTAATLLFVKAPKP